MDLILFVLALIALAILSSLLGFDSREMTAGQSLLDRETWRMSRSDRGRFSLPLPEFMGDTTGMLAQEKRSVWQWEASHAARFGLSEKRSTSTNLRGAFSTVFLQIGRIMVRVGFRFLALAADISPDQRRRVIVEQPGSG